MRPFDLNVVSEPMPNGSLAQWADGPPYVLFSCSVRLPCSDLEAVMERLTTAPIAV